MVLTTYPAAARIIYLYSTDLIMLIYGDDWSRDPRTEKLDQKIRSNSRLKLTYFGTIMKKTLELDVFRYVADSILSSTPTQRFDLNCA